MVGCGVSKADVDKSDNNVCCPKTRFGKHVSKKPAHFLEVALETICLKT